MRTFVIALCACAGQPIEQTTDQQLLSPPFDLSNTAAPSVIYYNFGNNLAVDGRAQVHAVWTEGDPSNASIAYRRSADDGLTWSTTFTFGASSMTGGPRVAASGDNVYVVWNGLYEGFLANYLIRSTDAGATFQPPVRISDPLRNASYPSIAATGSEVDIVWSDYRTDHSEVYLRRSVDAGATFALSLQVSTTDHHSSWTPCVAALGGAVHVAWTDERWDTVDCADINDTSKCHEEEYYRRWTPAGFGPEVRLTSDPAGAPKSSWAPSIVAGQDGVIHVAYFDQRTGTWRIYWRGPAPPTGATDIWFTASANSGATWMTPFALTQNIGVSSESSMTPMVALAPTGTNHIIWMQDAQEIVYERLY